MKCFFDSCDEAVEYASKAKSYGVYYSEKSGGGSTIHIHECCEIFFCLDGGKSFLIDDRVYSVAKNDLFVINQFEAHKVISEEDTRFCRYIMHVHPAFLYDNSEGEINLSDCFFRTQGVNKITLSNEERADMIKLFEALRVDYPYGDDLYKKLRAAELMLFVNRLFSTHTENSVQPYKHKSLQLAIDYINNNYSQDITLDTIAKNTYVSVNQLCRLFSRYCGTTVTRYITSKRITEAKKMLREGRSITDTAFMCGFNDYANFIRVFKKTVGIPPGKYKNCN